MQLPEKLMQSLEGVKGFDKDAFEKVHASGEHITSIRWNPLKLSESSKIPPSIGRHRLTDGAAGSGGAVPWTEYGFYLHERPSFTFDPLFHAGCYYVQEASSMFLEQALKQTVDLSQSLKVLDLSAAPGGKSTHIQSLISKDSLLVSNDVIRSRANTLKDNIIKWGCENVVVTNTDPGVFKKLESYFDVIVVDAPCSGSGLFRREPDAMDEWSENNVALCSQRQQRIVADVFPALKKDGILIYSTCSYSKEEDEEIVDWLMKALPVNYCRLQVDESWNITVSDKGYRFWPDKVKGEGFFMACFKKTEGDSKAYIKMRYKPDVVTHRENEIINKWIKAKDHQLIKNENTVYAWPDTLVNDMNIILSSLKVIYSGVRVGELMKDKLIPDHALAMSNLVNDSIDSIELNDEQAIRYLQRKDIEIETANKGWQLVSYEGHALGWINVLPNRINNYYPKELRILKDIKSPPL